MESISKFGLNMRLFLAIALLFGLLYILITIIAYFFKFGTPLLFAVLAAVMVLGQFLIGPRIVEWAMHVRYVSPEEAPRLHAMVEDLALKAGIPKPRVGISETSVPNAFAFGKTKGDGRVCVTRGLLNILNDGELKAVLGHELSHIRHNDIDRKSVV